jgi:hypothetical protein
MLENTEVATEQVAQTDSAVTEANAGQVTAADQTDQQEQAEERKFTQAELDAAIQKRLLKEERRIHRRLESQLREQLAQTVTQATPEPKREAFEDEQAYLEAKAARLAEQKAEELLRERQAREADERRREKFASQAEAVAERYPDFDAVVTNPRLPINEAMAEFIAESDIGAELAYALGKDHAKAHEIFRMTPIQAARALAKLEGEIAAKPKAQASRAPEPINPVGNRGKSTASSAPSDDDDVDTWMRKENARLAAQRRR